MNVIVRQYQVKAASGELVPPDKSGDWSSWFANEFNDYRGLAGENKDYSVQPDDTRNSPEDEPEIQMCNPEEYAVEVIILTNKEREEQGLNTLEMDSNLMELAQIRAEEVSTKYSHERLDETRLVQLGYGENVGAKSSPSAQVTSWMSSDGHRTNILLERYNRIGVGYYLASDGKIYWVQVFAP